MLVQAKDKCRRGHFWVLVADRDHVLFRFTPRHNQDGPKTFLRGYKGYVQADASSVYEELFRTEKVTEVGCWAHCRRRFFEAMSSDKERAMTALGFIHQLFAIDKATKELPPSRRAISRGAPRAAALLRVRLGGSRARPARAPLPHAGVSGRALLGRRLGAPRPGLAAVASPPPSLSHRTASLCPRPARRQDGLYRTRTTVPLAFAGGTAPSAMVPFVTAASKNWAEGTPVTVTDATLPMALEAMSVTTFVSQ
ncbi:hypothetical protein BE15_38400 [Sorangium cellulosum]|uniref:Transposase IS66 central domain-containing protein n=2 Tax=Sorangium cellulosum TaxID=56 RepID=A0A150QM16_SORCE|nr:hypothetical protein BE15_38400 [Sorangium cellulosum]